MAKRDIDERAGERVEVVLVTKQEAQQTVRLKLLKPVKLIIKGQITGNEYMFPSGGSEVDIDYEDAQLFLQKRYGGCDCPSDIGLRPYFEIVG